MASAMIALALAIAAAAVPRTLLDAADAANLAHAQCLFATMRAANQAHLPADAFERRLKSACSAEAQRLRRVSAKVFAARGESDPGAKADRLIEGGYRSAVEEYRRLPEMERQIRAVAESCKADPKSCD
jgi:hypothetical protein